MLFVLIALVTSTLATNNPLISQVDPTTQRQTVDAAVAERLGQTATAQAVATATATIDAAMQSAVSATAQAQATQAAEATLVEVAIQTAVQLSTEAAVDAQLTQMAFMPVTRNADWTPVEREFDGVTMVLVPVGCFDMGSKERDDEQPVHEQCFDQPFWIDKYEVTQAQFRRLGGRQANTSYFSGDNRPVERITWFEARDFCELRDVRLPTEAEWEYAARGPNNLVYPWGNTWNANNAILGGDTSEKTANVGSRPGGASWVRTLDMAGNVWEWTNSLYEPYPYNVDDGRERDSGIDTRVLRVLRGGSFDFTSYYLRASYRYRYYPCFEYSGFGFRCARSQE